MLQMRFSETIMRQVQNFFVVLIISLEHLSTSVNGAGDVKLDDYVDPFDYTSLVNIKDALLIGDTALAIRVSQNNHFLKFCFIVETAEYI